jgi:hypothetical protein
VSENQIALKLSEPQINPVLKVKILDNQDASVWNAFVKASKWGDIYQTWEWGEYQKLEGFKPLRIAVIRDKSLILTSQILLKKSGFLGNFAFLHHGPIFQKVEHLELGLPKLIHYLVHNSKIYDFANLEVSPNFGLDPNYNSSDSELISFKNNQISKETELGFYLDKDISQIFTKNKFFGLDKESPVVKKYFYILNSDENELLSGLEKTTRQNIKKVQNRNFKYHEYYSRSSDLPQKIKLFQELAAKRANLKLVIKPENLSRLFEIFKNKIFLGEAELDGKAAALVVGYRTKQFSGILGIVRDPAISEPALSDYILWQTVIKAQEFESKVFNFENVENLDNRFGAVSVLAYQKLILPINPMKFAATDTGQWLKEESGKQAQKLIKNTASTGQKISVGAWQMVVTFFKNLINKIKTTQNSKTEDLNHLEKLRKLKESSPNNSSPSISSSEAILDKELEESKKN